MTYRLHCVAKEKQAFIKKSLSVRCEMASAWPSKASAAVLCPVWVLHLKQDAQHLESTQIRAARIPQVYET